MLSNKEPSFTRQFTHLLGLASVAFLLAAVASPLMAATGDGRIFAEPEPTPIVKEAPSQYAARWGFAYENDFFVPGARDQDYTYGFSLSYASPSLREHGAFSPLKTIDKLVGVNDKAGCGSTEVGLYGFTPEDIERPDANHDDRPFASLVYASTAFSRLSDDGRTVTRSQLTYGFLGLDIVGQVQKTTHEILNGDTPAGWDHQISAGGEPTLRYSVSQQTLLSTPSSRGEWRMTKAISVGYITEATWSTSWRLGSINSAWNEFSPELASYAESSSNVNRSTNEWYSWGGIAIKARAYNAFLQGQFKDSEVTYASNELNHFILEGWLGVTKSFDNGYYASYGLRGHSSEVKSGGGDRGVIWGGIMVGKRLASS